MTRDSFWLGNLADIRQIEDPDSFDRSSTRVQSVFQGATGRITANTTGVKRTWALSWDDAMPDLRLWLEGFQTGTVGSKPLRFIDPYSVNQLDPRTASAGSSFGTRPVFSKLATGMTQTLIADATVPVSPIPRLVTRIVNAGSTAEASIGWPGLCVPWLGGAVTVSAYIKASASGQLKLYATTDDGEAYFSGTVATASVTGDNAWHLVTATGTPAPGTKGLYLAYQILGGGTTTVGPMQVQAGSTATPWQPGVGATVVMNRLSDAVHLVPYSGIELELLEA